jgi:hypothetical protein
LFNAFPRVVFPISVLASVTNQELASYAWIFPNVVTSGHWWYSNTPTFIEHDAAARLEAVPRTKQIAYYSDMYKLEFALPKFNMYKRILAKVLAERYIQDRGWSEERALELGRQVLRTNVEEIFRFHEEAPTYPEEPQLNRSMAFVGTQAEKLQEPTEELPAMREFQYWPQSASEGDDKGYDLSPAGSTEEKSPQLAGVVSPAPFEEVEEVTQVDESFAGDEGNAPLDSVEEYSVSDEDLLPEEPLSRTSADEEAASFADDFQLEEEERRE